MCIRIYFLWRCSDIANLDHLINDEITAPEVRLISDSGEQLGILPCAEAQKIADEEEAKKEQEILAKYIEVIAKIDALKDITSVTAENYAAAKAQYDEAKAAFDAIPAEDRTVVAENGYSEKLVAANKLITDYEEDVAALEANKDLIEAMKALDAYKEASAFTAENYAEAKAAIEAARAGENGKGFAVVADQVNALAGQIKVLVGDVNSSMETLQNNSEHLDTSMGQAQKALSVSKEKVEETQQVFKNIEESGKNVSDIRSTLDGAVENCISKFGEVKNSVSNTVNTIGNVADTMDKMDNPGETDYGYSYIKELVEEIQPKIDKYSK